MSSASGKTENAMILPYKRYEDSIEDETQKSNLLAQMRLALGYTSMNEKEEQRRDTTLWRYRNGKTRPRLTDRNAIAFVVNKKFKVDPKITGDDLFPEDFPYTGANKKKIADNDNA